MFLDPEDPLGSDIDVLTTQPYRPSRNNPPKPPSAAASGPPAGSSTYPGLQAGFYLAVGFGSVWVRETGTAHCCDGRVFWRIDLQTHEVVGRWRNPNSCAVGKEGVWLVRGENLYQIDPVTNEEELVNGVGRAWLVAVGNGAVWVTDFPAAGGTRLRELNPQTGVQVWQGFVPGVSAARLIAGDGYVWLEDIQGLEGTLTRVGAYGGHEISAPIRFGLSPATLAISPGALWVRFPESENSFRYDDARP